jgi:hypothetical protein
MKTRRIPSKEAATPVQEELALGDTPAPDKPRCGNCKHYTGTYCGLKLPPFIRVTDYVAHRVVHRDFLCSFHA